MIAGVLLDLSGVIYVGDKPLPGALDAVARLRDMNLPVRFVTNSTRTPRRLILKLLAGMGLACTGAELFTPAVAARRRLVELGLTPHLLVHPNLEEDFAGIGGSGGTAVVIGDAGEDFDYRRLNAAFRKLAAGAEFLALAGNRTFLDKDGELSLDAGAFVAALEYATRSKAVVVGKPAPEFFQAALASMDCRPADAVMVGDDAEADVSGAIAAGIGAGLLVRTGKYAEGAENDVDPPPTAVVDDLAAAVDWIEARLSS